MRIIYLFPAVAAAWLIAGCAAGGSKRDLTAKGDPAMADAATDAGHDQDADPHEETDAGHSQDGPCTQKCSEDLRSVIDCATGEVVETCPPNLGCGGSDCVPLCESAALNKSSIGCDYYAMVPGVSSEWGPRTGDCFAAFVANTSALPVEISVEFRGMKLPNLADFARIPSGSGRNIKYQPLPNGKLPVGEVAILFLQYAKQNNNDEGACPAGVKPAITHDIAIYETGLGHAFHITTSSPVVAYDIWPYGGGDSAVTSATLLLPVSVLGTNYVLMNAFRKSVNQAMDPFVQLVATEDQTEITINPTNTIVGGKDVASSEFGIPHTYILAKGQALQVQQEEELSGSVVQANKPIGVWGGANCLNIDTSDDACDAAHQQLPPVNALGSEYVAVRYRNRYQGDDLSPVIDGGTSSSDAGMSRMDGGMSRMDAATPDPVSSEEEVPWRMLGTVDGTKLTYVPARPKDAPATLDRGQVAEFWTREPFVVRSQDDAHPIYVSGHMTGCQRIMPRGSFDCRGDPEFVNVIPPQQYLSSYTFFTDPTYPETNLVVIRKRAKDGKFKDVSLDCAGKLAGWQALGDYEYTRIDLVRHNFEKQSSCDNGRHDMVSDAPFGVTVWGWGSAETGDSTTSPPGFTSSYVSYAYPAGARIATVNKVVVPL